MMILYHFDAIQMLGTCNKVSTFLETTCLLNDVNGFFQLVYGGDEEFSLIQLHPNMEDLEDDCSVIGYNIYTSSPLVS